MFIKANCGLLCPVIIERYKAECKATKEYEKQLKKTFGKSWHVTKRDLKKIADSFTNIDSDEYQTQKILNSVYRETIAHLNKNKMKGNLGK